MLVYIIGGVLGVALALYLLCRNQLYNHYITCTFCGQRNYLGTNKNPEFERDHLKKYKCSNCSANLL